MSAPSGGPRLPYRSDAELAADPSVACLADTIRARRAGGRLLNLDRMLLHSPVFAEGWNGLLARVRGGLCLDARLRELAICAVARLNHAPYEWDQHAGEWRSAGASEAQLAALSEPPLGWEADAAFDARERMVLALCRRMTEQVAVPPALLAEVENRLGRQACVELVGTVAAYNMVSRFLVALGVDSAGE